MRELQLAKSEGVDIGEDLEMRLARFQQEEDDKEKEMKKGGKVHPQDLSDSCGAGRSKLTRY